MRNRSSLLCAILCFVAVAVLCSGGCSKKKKKYPFFIPTPTLTGTGTGTGTGTVTDDSHEPDNDPAEAYAKGFFPPNTFFAGISLDDDVYAIYVPFDLLRVTISCLFFHAEGDIDIALFDDILDLMDFSASTTDDEDIDTIVLWAGTYYIEVTNLAMATGQEYDLMWFYW